MPEKIIVLGVNGAGPGGTTEKLLLGALAAAEKTGAEARLLQVAHLDLPIHTPGLAPCPATALLFSELYEANGIIFASYTQYYGVNPLMSNLIGWLDYLKSPDWPLTGKAGGCIAVCKKDGAQQAAAAMLAFMLDLELAIPPGGRLYHNKTMAEKSGRQMITDVDRVGRNVAKMARLLKNGSRNRKW